MKTDKDQQLYEVRGLVPISLKEQIEFDALKQLTSQKNIVGIAISQYYATLTENTVNSITQNYTFLCKKTQYLLENIVNLQKNNDFEVKITQILGVFKHNMGTSSYDTLRMLFFKDVIGLINEYKMIYPDRKVKIDRIVKRYVNKIQYDYYIQETATVKKPGFSKDLLLYNERDCQLHHVDDDTLDHPMTLIKNMIDCFKTVPFKFWPDKTKETQRYIKDHPDLFMDFDVAKELLLSGLETLEHELTENREK